MLALVAAVEPTVAAPPSSDDTASDDERGTRPIVVQQLGRELPGFDAALALRLPGHPLSASTAPRPELFDYVILDRVADDRTDLTFITHEGAAYDRRVEIEADQMVRTVANTLATLVSSIEAGDVLPDRTDVPIPPPPGPAPAPAPVPTPPPVVTSAPPPPPPRLELGPNLDAGAVIGVAPRTGASALAAGGARVGVDLRWTSGVVASFGVRMAGREADGLSLLRVRLSAGAGYAVRWTNVEIVTTAEATIEPWTVRAGGSRARLELDRRAAASVPLVGGLVRISPGIRLVPKGRSDVTFRLGARLEAAGSVVTQHGAHTIDIHREHDDGRHPAVLRAGGFELAVGLELAAWFGVGRRRAPR